MKLLVIPLMVLYLYSLTFGIFMTATFRIPAPLVFCFPLLFVFRENISQFLYRKELFVLLAALFCYHFIGLSNIIYFGAYAISIIICLLYFNYFVGFNRKRFDYSVLIFYLLLAFSAVVMVLNHFYGEIDSLRSFLMDEEVMQGPSGIAVFQFTFGYQLAALVSFMLIFTFIFHKPLIFKIVVFSACLIFIYLGMQRSVLITFALSVSLFMLFFYRMKAILIIGLAIFSGLLIYNYVLEDYFGRQTNILAKNINDRNPENNRLLLTKENLNIYSNYPLGLVFYGKNWGDAIYRNQVFASGITSHNAYLMFFTYLGPFLGLGLLFLIYGSIFRIGFNALKEIRHKDNALLICLCFSFLAISLNSLSHNAWLISADGPTVFLYFSILHLNKIKSAERLADLEIQPV